MSIGPAVPEYALAATMRSTGFTPDEVNITVLGAAVSVPNEPLSAVAVVFAVAASSAAIRVSSAVKLAFTADDEIVVPAVKVLGTAAIAISGSVSSAVTIHHLC